MILRADPAGLMVITQPAHAQGAGQLAEAWGNEQFPAFEPRREVCLAAGLHDLGWLAWESAPTLNPKTRRPFAFDEMPLETHAEIWSQGPRHALAFGRYVALLVSLHGTGLLKNHTPYGKAPRAAPEFLENQFAFQRALIASLQADPDFAPYTTTENVEFNQSLVRVTDALSLYASMGLNQERLIPGAPTVQGAVSLRMTPVNGDGTQIQVQPWPFRIPAVTIKLEGRHLAEQFDTETQMRSALANAPWKIIPIQFVSN